MVVSGYVASIVVAKQMYRGQAHSFVTQSAKMHTTTRNGKERKTLP